MGDDEALREQMREAIHGARRWSSATPDELIDAVLPVVQAHEKALADEVREYRSAISWDTTCFNCSKLLDRCYADTQRAETAEEALASLRDAVAHLADELDNEAGVTLWPPDDEYERGYRHGVDITKRDAARWLRSLLPQEGQE